MDGIISHPTAFFSPKQSNTEFCQTLWIPTVHKNEVMLVICSRHSFHWIFFSHLKEKKHYWSTDSHMVLSQNLFVQKAASFLYDTDYTWPSQISSCEYAHAGTIFS